MGTLLGVHPSLSLDIDELRYTCHCIVYFDHPKNLGTLGYRFKPHPIGGSNRWFLGQIFVKEKSYTLMN